MSSPLDSSQFVRLLVADLREVAENKFKSLTSMIPTFFNVMKSEKAWEEFYSIGSPGDTQPFVGKISYGSIAPGFHKKIEHSEYALGLVAERKLIDDKQYNVLRGFSEMLMESAHRTREKQGARAFAYGNSAAFDYMTSEEGVALFSDSHTTKAAVSTATGFDNLGSTALSKTAVAATRIIMRGFKDDGGQRISVGDDLALVLPDNLADLGMEIVGTQYGYDTASGDKNAQYGRYEIIPYLRLDDIDTNNWFMVWKSQMKKDLVWFDRVLPETKATVDWDSYQLKQAVYHRNSYGWKDWRWGYMHVVS